MFEAISVVRIKPRNQGRIQMKSQCSIQIQKLCYQVMMTLNFKTRFTYSSFSKLPYISSVPRVISIGVSLSADLGFSFGASDYTWMIAAVDRVSLNVKRALE